MMIRFHGQVPIALIGAIVATSLGCGGSSSSGGPSLTEQYRTAAKETDPALRVRKLVGVAGKQFGAGDSAGADVSLAAALQAAEELKDKASQANVLNVIGDSLGRNGNAVDAKKQLRRARSSADDVEDLTQRIPLLARCAEIMATRANDSGMALDILKEAEKLAGEISSDPAARTSALLRVVSAFQVVKASGDAERLAAVAIQSARELDDPRKRADGLSEAGEVASRVGMAEQGQELFAESDAAAKKIEDANSRGYAQLNLATRRIAAGAKADAAKSLAAAEATAEKVGDRALRDGLNEKIQQARGKL